MRASTTVSNSDLIALAVRRESGLDMLLREAARLRDETEGFTAMCRSKAGEVERLGERLRADHASNVELKLLIEAAKGDLASVNSRVDEAKLSATRESSETVEEDKRMQDERLALQRTKAEIDGGSEGLRQKLAAVVRELSAKRQALERDAEKEIRAAAAKNDELRGRIRTLQTALGNIEKESAETEAHMKRFSVMVDQTGGASGGEGGGASTPRGVPGSAADAGATRVPTPGEPLPRDPREWTSDDVLRWLSAELGLPAAVTSAVAATCLDGPSLASATDSQLAEVFGISHALHRRKILKNLQRRMPESAGGSGAQAVLARRS
jgi:hypothetical protein